VPEVILRQSTTGEGIIEAAGKAGLYPVGLLIRRILQIGLNEGLQILFNRLIACVKRVLRQPMRLLI
jgi:hypothetical protein